MIGRLLKRSGRLLNKTRSLQWKSSKNFETLTAEDYLFNQRDSTLTTKVHKAKLAPLPRSNHGEGTTDEITLYGIPKNAKEMKEYDTLQSSMVENHPDLLFLQVNPSHFLVRQRFLAHKSALKGVEDYHKAGIEVVDPIKPYSWEECVVNLVVLDMMRENKVHTELDYTRGFATYAYPYLQDDQTRKQLTKPFMESITSNIVGRNFSEYSVINNALYTGLMGKHKVMLGEMPELLYRMQLGNNLTLAELQDLFKFLKGKIDAVKQPMSFQEAAITFAPHIFQTPKDLYMTAMLKEALQAATSVVAFVGMPHYNPIQRGWVPPPHGINFEEATRIPERMAGETDEKMIEKHALLDVMLEKRAWGEKYISNPFPYLVDNITHVSQTDLAKMKECFLTNYKKYTQFKKMSLKELDTSLHGIGKIPKIDYAAKSKSESSSAKPSPRVGQTA